MFYGATADLTHITTVVTPATGSGGAGPYDLTTLAAVKAEPWYTPSLADAWLQRIITACSNSIGQYCNRVLVVQTYQDTIFPRRDPPMRIAVGGLNVVQVTNFPVIAPAGSPPVSNVSVTENGVALIENTDYIVDYDMGQITRYDPNTAYVMPWDEWPIVVQYKAGYAAGTPDMALLADACITFVKWRAFVSTRDPGLKSQSIPGDIEQTFLWGSGPGGPLNIPAEVTGIIDNYRVPAMG